MGNPDIVEVLRDVRGYIWLALENIVSYHAAVAKEKNTNVLRYIDFGNEAADDADPEELAAYFVEQDAFHAFLEPSKKFLVAHARKGVGKSALLQWIAYKQAQQDPDAIIIKCRGADLVRSKFNLSTPLREPNEFIRDWTVRICTLVNRHLAARINLALTDDSITLVETAELEGYKSRNLVGCLLDRLQSMLKRGGPQKLKAKDEVELLKRVTDRKAWILIDDLDATYQNTPEEALALATFFSACRYIMQDMKGVIIRVTMRTDVWALIRRSDEALDKAEQYVQEILWFQRDFLRLLALRVEASLRTLEILLPKAPRYVQESDAQERLLEMVFEPKMEWGTEYRAVAFGPHKLVDTYKVLYTLSYERPRWAIQLCKLAKEAALRHGATHIGKLHIDEIWGEFGAKRIADLVAEHRHQCPEIEELLNGFRGAKRQMSRDELFAWINNRVSTHIAPRIEGRINRAPMEIARFLYRLGFIMARSESVDGSYEHYRFDQMPDFLTARTDEDFGLKWEIHPCYREALDIKKLDRSHRERFSRLRRQR